MDRRRGQGNENGQVARAKQGAWKEGKCKALRTERAKGGQDHRQGGKEKAGSME
jgi:hypothetical protein